MQNQENAMEPLAQPVKPLDPYAIPVDEQKKLPAPNMALAEEQKLRVEKAIKNLLGRGPDGEEGAISKALSNITKNYSDYKREHPDEVMGKVGFIWNNLGDILKLALAALMNIGDVLTLKEYFTGTKYDNLKDASTINNLLRKNLVDTLLMDGGFLAEKDIGTLGEIAKVFGKGLNETEEKGFTSQDLFKVLDELVNDRNLTEELRLVVGDMFVKLSTGQGDWVGIVGRLTEAVEKVPGMQEMLASKSKLIEATIFGLCFREELDKKTGMMKIYLNNPMGINMAQFGVIQDRSNHADGKFEGKFSYINHQVALFEFAPIKDKHGKIDYAKTAEEKDRLIKERVNGDVFKLVTPIVKREDGIKELREIFNAISRGMDGKASYLELIDQATTFLANLNVKDAEGKDINQLGALSDEFGKMLVTMLPPFLKEPDGSPMFGINEAVLGIATHVTKTPKELAGLMNAMNGGDGAEIVESLRKLLNANPNALKYIQEHGEEFKPLLQEVLKKSLSGDMANIGAKLPAFLDLLGNGVELLLSKAALEKGGILDNIVSILEKSRYQSAANTISFNGVNADDVNVARDVTVAILGKMALKDFEAVTVSMSSGKSITDALRDVKDVKRLSDAEITDLEQDFKLLLATNVEKDATPEKQGEFLANIAGNISNHADLSRVARAVYSADAIALQIDADNPKKKVEDRNSPENRQFLAFLKSWKDSRLDLQGAIAANRTMDPVVKVRLEKIVPGLEPSDLDFVLAEYSRIDTENQVKNFMSNPDITSLDKEVAAHLFAEMSKAKNLDDIKKVMTDYPIDLNEKAIAAITKGFSTHSLNIPEAARLCDMIAQGSLSSSRGMMGPIMKATESLLDDNKGKDVIGLTKRLTEFLLADPEFLNRSLKGAQKFDLKKDGGAILKKFASFLEKENVLIEQEAKVVEGKLGLEEKNKFIAARQALLAKIVEHYFDEVPALARIASKTFNGKLPLDMLTNLIQKPSILKEIGGNLAEGQVIVGNIGNALSAAWQVGLVNLVGAARQYMKGSGTSDVADAGLVPDLTRVLSAERKNVVPISEILSKIADAKLVAPLENQDVKLKPEQLQALGYVKSSKCALDYISLDGANLGNIDFTGYSLIGAKIKNVDFTKSTLKDVDFSKVEFSGNISFEGATIDAATLASIIAGKDASKGKAEIDLKGVKLIGDFKGFQFDGIDLSGADLSGLISLERANISGVNFTDITGLNPKLLAGTIGLPEATVAQGVKDEVMPSYNERKDLVVERALVPANSNHQSISTIEKLSSYLGKNHPKVSEQLQQLSIEDVKLFLGEGSKTSFGTIHAWQEAEKSKAPAHRIGEAAVGILVNRLKLTRDELTTLDKMAEEIARAVFGDRIDTTEKERSDAKAVNRQLISYMASASPESRQALLERYQANKESVLGAIGKGGLTDIFYQQTHRTKLGVGVLNFELDSFGNLAPEIAGKIRESLDKYMLTNISLSPEQVAVLDEVAKKLAPKDSLALQQKLMLAFGNTENGAELISYFSDNQALLNGKYSRGLDTIINKLGVGSQELPVALR